MFMTSGRKVTHIFVTFQSRVHFFGKALQGFPLHSVPFVFALVVRPNNPSLFLSAHVYSLVLRPDPNAAR